MHLKFSGLPRASSTEEGFLDAMTAELLSKFRRACTISSFLAAKEDTSCDARKMGVDLIYLAMFKYLLPDEISFGYMDSPADLVYGDAPDQLLVFKFNDKRATKRRNLELSATIKERINRFETALNEFTESNKAEHLKELAKQYLPAIDPYEDLTKEESSTLSFSDNTKTVDREKLFDSVCANLKNIITKTTEPGREPKFGEVPEELLESLGKVEKLWSHQSRGIHHLLESGDNHLVISTATASGKSLIFHSLVRNHLSKFEEGTALFIYPTKALAQDQLRSFGYSDQSFTFDGDTTWEKRRQAQQSARVLLVNPDIMHTTILPKWKDWCRFLSELRYVVIDELHYYGGIFGANVAMIIRRLRRLCDQLGASPCQYISCSATLNDPKGLMSKLTGLPSESILALTSEVDGSPSGKKSFVFSTPDYMTPSDPTSGRMHPIKEAAPLLVRMIRSGMRVIAFCRFRRECELMLRAVYEIDKSLISLVRAYRGGYSPEDRRALEASMFNGDLLGIVATTALEVGIDIGNLDAAIIVGFPHSIASFRQQVGRIGRRQHDSLVVYVADGSVLDQAYASNPEKVLKGPIGEVQVVLHESIVRSHIQAAAYELALDESEIQKYFPGHGDLGVAKLEKLENGSWTYPLKTSINLRKAESEHDDTLVIDVQTNKVIETVEFERVGFTLYDGAIFVHQGKAFIVIHLDPDFVYAKVQRTHVKWVTRQRDYTDVDPLKTVASKQISTICAVSRGLIRVTNKVFGYFKFNEQNQIIDSIDLSIPPTVAHKTGFFINLPYCILNTLKQRDHHVAASIHGAEHTVISVLPMFVSMAPGDVATECKAPQKEILSKHETQRHRPGRLIFYEKYGGELGNGILISAYNQVHVVLERASDALDTCPCELGCGACIGSGYCVEQNAVLSKSGARVILRMLLEKSLEEVPIGPEPNLPRQSITTVVSVDVPVQSREEFVPTNEVVDPVKLD